MIRGIQPGSKQVFSHETIEKTGAHSAAEFLDMVGGISIRKDATSGGQEFARIGGSNTNQVAVLVDGLKISDVGSGESDLSKISVERIESIEVVRGGNGTVAESIGGAILIRTRSPEQDGLRLSGETSETLSTLSATRTWRNNDFTASIDASREQGQGDYRFRITEADGNGPFTAHLGEVFKRDNNHLLRDHVSGRLAQTFGIHEFSGTYSIERAAFGLPGYLAPRPTPEANQDELKRSAQVNWNASTSKIEVQSAAGFQSQQKNYNDSDPYSFLHESHESSSRYSLFSQVSRGTKAISIEADGRLEREALSSGVLTNDQATRNRWRAGTSFTRHIQLAQSAARVASITGFFAVERFGDSQLQSLPGAEVFFANKTSIPFTMGGRYSKAYRAPSFYSLFWNDELLAQGNPDLRPESSIQYEAYAKIGSRGVYSTSLEIDASHNIVKDLIYWRQAFDGRWTPQNLRRATLDNYTVGLKQVAVPNHLEAECSMEWLEARDRSGDRVSDGKYLIYRPLRTLNARVSAEYRQSFVVLESKWVSKQAVLETNSKWLPAYTLVNAEWSQRFRWAGAGWQAALRCANVLNSDYRVIRFAPMPLREYSISLTCDLWSASRGS